MGLGVALFIRMSLWVGFEFSKTLAKTSVFFLPPACVSGCNCQSAYPDASFHEDSGLILCHCNKTPD